MNEQTCILNFSNGRTFKYDVIVSYQRKSLNFRQGAKLVLIIGFAAFVFGLVWNVRFNFDHERIEAFFLSDKLNQNVVLTHGAVKVDGKWEVLNIRDIDDVTFAAATAAFSEASSHASYFGEFHVRSIPNAAYSDEERAEAAGVLEGFLTHSQILQTAENLFCEVNALTTNFSISKIFHLL
jgi:hypothetical protein